ncbi:MAG: hypothetical protein EKK54_05965 [Neisseriaceae bacterium]|nr:MAG: hypothetical protein EKK54_05965 [Neisseriaceae bacterium]
MAYKHLGENERFVIELMLSKGTSKNEIGKLLGYCRQTIMREIARNSDKDGSYKVQRAHDISVCAENIQNRKASYLSLLMRV